MSIITGSLAPDEGWATVAGFDVVRQRAQLRKSLGVCPQFDVLYKDVADYLASENAQFSYSRFHDAVYPEYPEVTP